MLSRYTNDCSFCARKIVAGKHHITKCDGKWIHRACATAKEAGVIPTSAEDMGPEPSCGICYGCVKVRSCYDAHVQDDEERNPEDEIEELSDEDDVECVGCESGIDFPGAHTCKLSEYYTKKMGLCYCEM